MARRIPGRRRKQTRSSRTSSAARRSAKRPSKAARRTRKATAGKTRSIRGAKSAKKKASAKKRPRQPVARPAASRLNRERRRLEDLVPTPPSSLDLQRRGSSVRSGRAELADEERDHLGMPRALTGGDVDVDVEDAYFTGDEAPGGDNPTPDQEVVDDIGRALGVEYQDNEELKTGDKVSQRDKHRWELDPASSEDYPERKK
jgi:hypothetical protein